MISQDRPFVVKQSQKIYSATRQMTEAKSTRRLMICVLGRQ